MSLQQAPHGHVLEHIAGKQRPSCVVLCCVVRASLCGRVLCWLGSCSFHLGLQLSLNPGWTIIGIGLDYHLHARHMHQLPIQTNLVVLWCDVT